MSAFSFFRKKEAAGEKLVTETASTRLERTSVQVIEHLTKMTFDQNSGLTGLRVQKVRSLVPEETWLSVTGLIPGNEIGLGKAHLEPIAEQINTELETEARPYRVVVEAYRTNTIVYGEDSATDSASYILKIRNNPREEVSDGNNVIHATFDRR